MLEILKEMDIYTNEGNPKATPDGPMDILYFCIFCPYRPTLPNAL